MLKNITLRKIPNILTSTRIILSSISPTVTVFSKVFWILYFICGITDILDGFFARKFKVQVVLVQY
ncbi:CDP-alcohol phosphatidyltransferase family protein [Miniphocaeibacter massiliensis]|uniref:CDP-alcohol phosphatidyltransferase family protein n=1 Tax=Miniphocaeibacter massiliensis TaxID=2041841 RepID=UPI000C1C2DF5|nr:CDP-alcohol phosphatidyltransferase family protein [Miniphocaeibacter massiliensis]